MLLLKRAQLIQYLIGRVDSVKIKYNQIAHLFSPDINLSISPSIG
jgi:hypothetical protein